MDDLATLRRAGWEIPERVVCVHCGAVAARSIGIYEAFGERMAPLVPEGWLRRKRSLVETQYACSVACALNADEKEPICKTCKDTHRMVLHDGSGDERMVMCTRCPVPCRECGKGGPFCVTTPCGCECHRKMGRRTSRETGVERRLEDDAVTRLAALLRHAGAVPYFDWRAWQRVHGSLPDGIELCSESCCLAKGHRGECHPSPDDDHGCAGGSDASR